jgi:hypothetical protein
MLPLMPAPTARRRSMSQETRVMAWIAQRARAGRESPEERPGGVGREAVASVCAPCRSCYS